MKILVFVTDAFGGHGGIAKFNRDLLTSLSMHPECETIDVIPRVAQNKIVSIPSLIHYEHQALKGKYHFVKSAFLVSLRKRNLDIIVCAHINLLPIAYLTSLISKCPLVLIGHGVDIWQPTGRVFTDWCASRIDYFIGVSDLTRRRFISWSNIDDLQTAILPNSIDRDVFFPGKRKNELLERYELQGKQVLLTFGRLAGRNREKGFDEVLELLPDLVKENKNIVYLIAGSGPDLARLIDKSERLGIADRVRFTGYVKDSDKVDIFRLADVYVMPSKGEGFGIVFLEAMACGIPVIASAIDGSREAVLDGQLGTIVNPDNPHEIREAILDSLTKKHEVPEKLVYFSFENFVSRVHILIDNIRKKE